jgi:glutathione S-transferase
MDPPSLTAETARLYHNPFSSSARRAVLVVKHLRLPVELVLVKNLHDPDERAQLTAINPNAKIPVLQHGSFVLWESTAIMQYLADLSPGQTLYPAELRARADVNRWLAWGGQHWSPALGVLTWERWMKGLFGLGEADPSEVARGERDFEQFARVADARLAKRQWIAGEGLTLADFAIATPLMRVREASVSLEPFPNLSVWLERIRALDAWKQSEPQA